MDVSLQLRRGYATEYEGRYEYLTYYVLVGEEKRQCSAARKQAKENVDPSGDQHAPRNR